MLPLPYHSNRPTWQSCHPGPFCANLQRLNMKYSPPPRGRRAIAAFHTIERCMASLDSSSVVALEWAQQWCRSRFRLKPQPAVVIRRALARYAHHLDNINTPEAERAELVALEGAGKGTGSALQLTQARARIEAAEGRPLAWLDALMSPEARKAVRDVDAAVERHLGGSR